MFFEDTQRFARRVRGILNDSTRWQERLETSGETASREDYKDAQWGDPWRSWNSRGFQGSPETPGETPFRDSLFPRRLKGALQHSTGPQERQEMPGETAFRDSCFLRIPKGAQEIAPKIP